MGFHTSEQLVDTQRPNLVILKNFISVDSSVEGYLIYDPVQLDSYVLRTEDVVSGRLRVPYWWEYDDVNPHLKAYMKRKHSKTQNVRVSETSEQANSGDVGRDGEMIAGRYDLISDLQGD